MPSLQVAAAEVNRDLVAGSSARVPWCGGLTQNFNSYYTVETNMIPSNRIWKISEVNGFHISQPN
jgi:hypothetical protein